MSEEAPKLRLRPKLAVDTPAAPIAAEAPPVAPSPAESAPSLAIPPPPEAKSIRLKPRVAIDVPSAPAAVQPPPPAAPPISTPPPIAFAAVVPAPAPAPLPRVDLRPSPATPPPTPVGASTAPASIQPASVISAIDYAARARKVHRAAFLILGGGVLVFSIVGYFAFPRLMARHERFQTQARADEKSDEADAPSRPASPKTNPTPANGATPPPPAETPSTASASTPSAASLVPASAPTPPTTQPTKTAGMPRPPSAAPDVGGSGDASIAFRGWVQNLKITGVRTGAAPKISFGGASYSAGETINHDLGIRFEGYDAPRRMLLFKDATGAIVERRH